MASHTTERTIPGEQLNMRGRIGLMAMCAAASAAVVGVSVWGNGVSTTALQSSTTLQFNSGSDAVLSSSDFVPLTNSGNPASAAARRELDGLYAAAGIKMKSPHARQQQLVEVASSGDASARPQTQIDPGSKVRLSAAASGNLNAFSRDGEHGRARLRSEQATQALGSTIARYFRASENKL